MHTVTTCRFPKLLKSSVTGNCYYESSKGQCNWQGTLQVCRSPGFLMITWYSHLARSAPVKATVSRQETLQACNQHQLLAFFQVSARLCASCSSSNETLAPMRASTVTSNKYTYMAFLVLLMRGILKNRESELSCKIQKLAATRVSK